MPIAHCRKCGKIMSNDFREFDNTLNKSKIFCRKCRSIYRKGTKLYCDCHNKKIGSNGFDYFEGKISWFCPITKEPCEVVAKQDGI